MLKRTMGSLAAAVLVLSSVAWAQTESAGKDPVADGRKLSQWVADLKAPAPQTRNAAAYEISGLGPAAVSAVPALIEALDDPEPTVRFPVTVALAEIGPKAAAAVPKLKKMVDDEINDEIAAAARRALRRIAPQALNDDQ